jgi:hypothetical protein
MPYIPGIAFITEVVSSLSQIMPELQEICGESTVVVTMELGSLDASAMSMMPSPSPSEPCQPPTFVDSGCVLAPNSKTLFGKDSCGLLVGWKQIALDMARRLLASWRERLVMT